MFCTVSGTTTDFSKLLFIFLTVYINPFPKLSLLYKYFFKFCSFLKISSLREELFHMFLLLTFQCQQATPENSEKGAMCELC